MIRNAARLDNAAHTRYIYATAMKPDPQDSSQAMQRVRVAMTGLAAVAVLIGLAGAAFNFASSEPAVTEAGAPKADVVANMTDTAIDNMVTNEPLAEIGVAPSATGNLSDTPSAN